VRAAAPRRAAALPTPACRRRRHATHAAALPPLAPAGPICASQQLAEAELHARGLWRAPRLGVDSLVVRHVKSTDAWEVLLVQVRAPHGPHGGGMLGGGAAAAGRMGRHTGRGGREERRPSRAARAAATPRSARRSPSWAGGA
jgi:hypothetical protein